MTFLVMTNAFFRAPVERLKLKIKSPGLANPLCSWLASYLSCSSQVVSINGTPSQPQPFIIGVIHSSVLGTLLFLLYVNEVFRALRHGKAFLFADRIKIVYSLESYSLPQNMAGIMEDSTTVDEWGRQWALRFSANKIAVLAYRCLVPLRRLFITGLPVFERLRLTILPFLQLP